MRRILPPALIMFAALAACDNSTPQKAPIKVTSPEQQQLHKLDAFNLAIGLKRAIYAAGYLAVEVVARMDRLFASLPIGWVSVFAVFGAPIVE